MTNKTVLSNEQIGKALHDAGILDLECVALRYDLDIARATEQAVLQSPEIQQLHKDAERYRWLRNESNGTAFGDGVKAPLVFNVDDNYQHEDSDILTLMELDAAIDASMEVKP